MERTDLFINILNDLRIKISSQNPYQLLKASELVRSLLFDTSGPLVDKINREFKLKIIYQYSDFSKCSSLGYMEKLGASMVSIGDGLYPPRRIAEVGPVVETGKDNFLSTPVLYLDSKLYSVKELLDFALYALGGTHHSDKRLVEEQALKRLNESKIFGVDFVLYQITAISQVVIEALRPLEEEVNKSSNSDSVNAAGS